MIGIANLSQTVAHLLSRQEPRQVLQICYRVLQINNRNIRTP